MMSRAATPCCARPMARSAPGSGRRANARAPTSTSKRSSASRATSLPLDEKLEEAEATRREDGAEDAHDREVVAELGERCTTEQLARRGDGREQRGREQREQDAGDDEIARARSHRHRAEE